MAALPALHVVHVMRQLVDARLDDLYVLPAFRKDPKMSVVRPVIAVPCLQLLFQVLNIEPLVLRQFRVTPVCIIDKVIQYVFQLQHLSPRLFVPFLFHFQRVFHGQLLFHPLDKRRKRIFLRSCDLRVSID